MEPLIEIIKTYESDTFSASALQLTPLEAEMLARTLFTRLCEIAEEGGTMRCDGDVLSAYLEELRDEDSEHTQDDDGRASEIA